MSKKVYFPVIPYRVHRPEDDDDDFSDTLSDELETVPNYIETNPPPNVDILQNQPTQHPSPRDFYFAGTSGDTRHGCLPLDELLRTPSPFSDVEMEEAVLSNRSTSPTTPSAPSPASTPSTAPTTPNDPPITTRTATASTRVPKTVPILCPWGDCRVWVMGPDYRPLRKHINSEHVRGVTGDTLKCQWPGCEKVMKLPRGVGGHMNKHYRGG